MGKLVKIDALYIEEDKIIGIPEPEYDSLTETWAVAVVITATEMIEVVFGNQEDAEDTFSTIYNMLKER
jgi:hypothetical protein